MTPPSKRDQISHLVEKSRESLLAADELLRNGHEEFSVSRAYYAMFYLAEALLLTKDLSFAKHSGVIAAFGRHFIKAGLFDPELREMLAQAFEDRTEGDYGFMEGFSGEEALEALNRAKHFCRVLQSHLDAHPI